MTLVNKNTGRIYKLHKRKIFKSIFSNGLFKTLKTIIFMTALDEGTKDDSLYLDHIAIANNAQGTGLGTKLLNTLSKIAKEDGYDTITLKVIGSNAGAKKLYEKHGFVVTKKDTGFLNKLINEEYIYEMEKLIK